MTQAPIAERLDALHERARAELRNPALVGIVADMIGVLREIDARKAAPAPGTGIASEQLTQAIGGVEFVANLGAMLDKIDRARAEDVERVLIHLFAARPPAPRNGPAP